jgi:hypothetical protein
MFNVLIPSLQEKEELALRAQMISNNMQGYVIIQDIVRLKIKKAIIVKDFELNSNCTRVTKDRYRGIHFDTDDLKETIELELEFPKRNDFNYVHHSSSLLFENRRYKIMGVDVLEAPMPMTTDNIASRYFPAMMYSPPVLERRLKVKAIIYTEHTEHNGRYYPPVFIPLKPKKSRPKLYKQEGSWAIPL